MHAFVSGHRDVPMCGSMIRNAKASILHQLIFTHKLLPQRAIFSSCKNLLHSAELFMSCDRYICACNPFHTSSYLEESDGSQKKQSDIRLRFQSSREKWREEEGGGERIFYPKTSPSSFHSPPSIPTLLTKWESKQFGMLGEGRV